MSDERDTHFKKFAQNLLDELNNRDREESVLRITQRAYDLANHIIRHLDHDDIQPWFSYKECPMELVEDYTHIPDLTEWPKVDDASKDDE